MKRRGKCLISKAKVRPRSGWVKTEEPRYELQEPSAWLNKAFETRLSFLTSEISATKSNYWK